jgi:hypothetical protein
MTAVLMSAVLLIVTAFAVDASALYAEKRELQNVADFGALAIAEDCVNRPAACSQINAESKAAELAAANSTDGLADVRVTLEPGKVTVEATTRNPTGTVMPGWFSGASDNGTMMTRAVVVWGSLGAWSGGLPITVDVCEWSDAVGSPDGPFPSAEVALIFHSTSALPAQSTCPESSGPHADNPGGFGLLDGAQDDKCATTTTADGYAAELDGNQLGSVFGKNGSCADDLKGYIDAGAKLYLPLYDSADGAQGHEYHLAGYAAFVLTGYFFGNSKAYPASTNCGVSGPGSANTYCVRGYFTDSVAPTGSDAGGGDYGVTTPPALAE